MAHLKSKIWVLTGPSGCGKNEQLARIKRHKRVEGIQFIPCVTHTTRPPGPDEDPADYNRETYETFLRRAARGEFLEFKESQPPHFYGSPLAPFREAVDYQNEHKVVLLQQNFEGAAALADWWDRNPGINGTHPRICFYDVSDDVIIERTSTRGRSPSETDRGIRLARAEEERQWARLHPDRYWFRIISGEADPDEITEHTLDFFMG